MTDARINLPLSKENLLTMTCRNQHQTWATTITRTIKEIEHLLFGLTDVLERQPYPGRIHQAVVQYAELNRLKSDLYRLQSSLICGSAVCVSTEQQNSCKLRIQLYSMVAMSSRLQKLTNDVNRLKTQYAQLTQ